MDTAAFQSTTADTTILFEWKQYSRDTDSMKTSHEGIKMRTQSFLLIFLCIVFSFKAATPLMAQEDWSFSTLPSNGQIQGTAGQTIGWGYTITNNSPDEWLWVYQVTASGPFAYASTFVPFDYPSVAPDTTVTVDFDQGGGLYATIWDNNAPVGFSNSGTFSVSGSWFDNDPFDPVNPGNYLGEGGILQANYTATIVSSATAVPEPGTQILFLCCLTVIAFAVFHLYRSRSYPPIH